VAEDLVAVVDLTATERKTLSVWAEIRQKWRIFAFDRKTKELINKLLNESK
jgi:hypothetical protein